MITELAYVGKYLFIGTYYLIENRNFILSAYSLYDLTKFTFTISDRLGVVEVVKKKIKPSETCVIIIDGKENSVVGDFEIIDCF